MTISIRIWQLDPYFELKLIARREPEPDLPAAMPAVGFMTSGPDYRPDEI